jgi:hypothetical protein
MRQPPEYHAGRSFDRRSDRGLPGTGSLTIARPHSQQLDKKFCRRFVQVGAGTGNPEGTRDPKPLDAQLVALAL